MKIIHSNFKKGDIKIKVENLDDLWYLSQIIDISDKIQGKTERKLKIGGETDRTQKTVRKIIFVLLDIERVEFSKHSNTLRVSGVVSEGTEDVQRGSHHTFNIEINTIFSLIKKEWLQFQIDRIKEASNPKVSNLMICILDRETALFAKLEKYGYKLLGRLEGDVEKKDLESGKKANFYVEIIKTIEEYDKRHNFENIVVASPAFWKEYLIKEIKSTTLKKKIVSATCSSATETAINEVLKRDEVKKILEKERTAKEIKLVEKLLFEISKNNLAAYGIKETEQASDAGAIESLLVTDSYIRKTREENIYEKVERIMKNTEKSRGKVTIISSENDAGKKLNGLGGIGAILRYKLSY
ncbi:mRNA surveillance protein pelota [Candidatus Woesearchaeota archaeon]|nr:mRNA surveillance protein pelota [Candidatus Woesearchaeota archaeon]